MTAPARSLRILWTLPYFPWPASNGGKTRAHALLRQMAARGHRVTLLVLTKDQPSPEALAYLNGFLESLVVVPRRRRTDPATLWAAVASLSRPAVAAVNGCNAAYARQFAAHLAQGFDLVHAEHSYAFEPLAEALGQTAIPVFVSEGNVELDVVGLQFRRLGWPLRELGRLERLRARRWERRVVGRATCVVAVSRRDRDAFTAMGARAASIVANCIDTGALATVRRDAAAKRVTYLGNYEYAPNVDAVRWLCDEVMPLIWRRAPETRLSVCGHAMPAGWRARWTDARIAFEGYVHDLSHAYSQSSVFLAPLRAGGGSKLKVIEAMAAGLPVVGTAQAVSGLGVTAGQHFLHGEDAAQLATAAVTALRDIPEADAIGARAREYAARHHDWKVAAQALEATFLAWTPELQPELETVRA